MATLQPGQITTPGQAGPNGGTATIDQNGFMHHPDNPVLHRTNDTGDSGVPAPSGVTATAAPTGGTIGPDVAVSYKVTATTANGESLPSTAATDTTSAGTTDSVVVDWPDVPGATGYKVYGRTDAAWGLLSSPASSTYTDTGADTPGAAPPVTNTSGDLATGVEGGSHILGATIASGLVRPTVDTRNATNVGAVTGPDTEAPRVWE